MGISLALHLVRLGYPVNPGAILLGMSCPRCNPSNHGNKKARGLMIAMYAVIGLVILYAVFASS